MRINGKSAEEPYVTAVDPVTGQGVSSGMDQFGPVVIPRDEYFVLGDNRNHSLDSRQVGPIPRHSIKGKPMVIYFSTDRIFKWRVSRIGEIIR
jgi:signal peptidase I